jgi:glycosyltransferase involved in cell wall biosynthesis
MPHAILPIAESIFLGKPVLSANTPEALEYSDDGNGANLFEINNNVDFIKKLTYVYENEKDIYTKAVGSQNTIKNKFSMHNNTEKLNKLYKKLLIC